ncbi:MAG: hypothetical protein WD357_02030 [Gracilimonas sp.]
MNLLERIKTRAPEYDAKYYQLILDYTIEQGAGMGTASEEDKWTQGKYFSTRYEIYMYATLLGLKRDYPIPIESGTEKKKFIEIESWKPQEIANYIIMGVLAKSDIGLFEIENMEESEVEKFITDLKTSIESYANGGFDIIRSKAEEEPTFFTENDNSFLDLLDE